MSANAVGVDMEAAEEAEAIANPGSRKAAKVSTTRYAMNENYERCVVTFGSWFSLCLLDAQATQAV
jgi:hypothetical protein